MIRTISSLICLVTFAFGTLSCTKQPMHPLRVSAHDWPSYELLYLASSLNLYDGANIRLIDSPSASETSRALRNGTIEAGAVTLDEALTLLQDNVDIRVAMVFDASHGADVLITRNHILHLADLKGKRIGAEINAVGAYMLDAALRKAGLTVNDISVIPINADSHLQAWQTLSLDGIVTFEPVKTALLFQKNHVLFDSRALPLPLLDVLVIRKDALDSHAQAVQDLMTGYFKALKVWQSQPERASRMMAKRLKLSEKEVVSSFGGIKLHTLADNAAMFKGGKMPCDQLLAIATPLQALMIKRNLLERASDLSHFCAPETLLKIAQQPYANL